MEFATNKNSFQARYFSFYWSSLIMALLTIFSLQIDSSASGPSFLGLPIGNWFTFAGVLLTIGIIVVGIASYLRRTRFIVTIISGMNFQNQIELHLKVVSGSNRQQIRSFYVRNESWKKLPFIIEPAEGFERKILLMPHDSSRWAIKRLQTGDSKKIRFYVKYGRFRKAKTEWRKVDLPFKGLSGIS